MSYAYQRQCEECGASFQTGDDALMLCHRCDVHYDKRTRERARLARPPRRCDTCEGWVEVDRQANTRRCLHCLGSPSLIAKAMPPEFVEPGTWRAGPVTFDWSGEVSVARCDACSFSVLRFGERSFKTAIHHARFWHGHAGGAVRVLAPMSVAECEADGCDAPVAVSEDYSDTRCRMHRNPSGQEAGACLMDGCHLPQYWGGLCRECWRESRGITRGIAPESGAK